VGLAVPGSERVCYDTIMHPFAVDILARAAKPGDAISLILDQSKLSDRHQVLMLSVRWGERALPVAWRVEETEGAIVNAPAVSTPKRLCSTRRSRGCKPRHASSCTLTDSTEHPN